MNGVLENKIAVITGAARGIGRAVAEAFAKSGAHIVGIDIVDVVQPSSGVKPATKEDLDETGRRVRSYERRWMPVIIDQRDYKALSEYAKTIENEFGRVDILFANAGIQAFKPLLEMTDDDWHIQIDVNLTGTANMIRAFAPIIVKNRGGRIIVTSSSQGRHGTKYGAAYSASKWGLIGLVKSAALEFGVYGTTVNAVVPGLIDTELTRHEERYAQVIESAGEKPTGNLEQDEAKAKAILTKKTPLQVPWIDPKDVAPLAVFLASDSARMISGAVLDVTGGDSANYQ
ncbi:MAG: putative short-chain type dehydrogenase/reductase [Bacteriovoracaceae bacterium]|nr:putative short-chain type dehydrogenase/reductase [Bacteriovoracaceae bacterium]